MKSEKAIFSPIQKFLWLISGSEISILKRCPTDFNRHAGIGFTILMTTLFGAFAGGYAGYYFSKSYVGAIAFGTLWGLLIFSIDRTMVVSLKKRPEIKPGTYFWQILFRAILAALIAFIISIPLELLIFKDNIDAGLSFYKGDQQLKLISIRDSIDNPTGDSKKKVEEEQVAEKADSMSRLDPQTAEFRNLVADLSTKSYELKQLKSALAVAQGNSIKHYNNSLRPSPRGGLILNKSSISYQSYLFSKKKEKVLKADIRKLASETKSIAIKIQEKREDWSKQRGKERDTAKSRAEKVQNEIDREKIISDSVKTRFDSTLAKVDQSFVVRFDVLTYLANKKTKGEREFPSIFFLLWLVRILFFVIEILPTIVKVATPLGAYDIAIIEEEENFKNVKLPAAKKLLIEKLEDENTLEKEERERQLKLRLKKEGELHDKLVDEISTTQNIVATKILDDWRAKNTKTVG